MIRFGLAIAATGLVAGAALLGLSSSMSSEFAMDRLGITFIVVFSGCGLLLAMMGCSRIESQREVLAKGEVLEGEVVQRKIIQNDPVRDEALSLVVRYSHLGESGEVLLDASRCEPDECPVGSKVRFKLLGRKAVLLPDDADAGSEGESGTGGADDADAA